MRKFLVLTLAISLQTAHEAQGANGWNAREESYFLARLLVGAIMVSYITPSGHGLPSGIHELPSSRGPVAASPSLDFPAYRELLGVISSGGADFESDINRLLGTADGLKALSLKDLMGRFPEDIVQDEALKAKMKGLREDYETFSSLSVEHMTGAQKKSLESFSQFILEQPRIGKKNQHKARAILEAIRVSEDAVAQRRLVEEKAAAVKGFIGDIEKGPLAQLFKLADEAIKKKKRKDWDADVQAQCAQLVGQYTELLTTRGSSAVEKTLFDKLISQLGTLKGKNNGTINASMPWEIILGAIAEEPAVSAGAGVFGVSEAAEAPFDFAGAPLGRELFRKYLTTKGAAKSRAAALIELKIRAASEAMQRKLIAGGIKPEQAKQDECITLSSRKAEQFLGRLNAFLERPSLDPSSTDKKKHTLREERGVLYSARKAWKRGEDTNMIYGMLKYGCRPLFKEIYEMPYGGDRATVGTRETNHSLTSRGGKNLTRETLVQRKKDHLAALPEVAEDEEAETGAGVEDGAKLPDEALPAEGVEDNAAWDEGDDDSDHTDSESTGSRNEDFSDEDEPAGVSAVAAPMDAIPALELPSTLGSSHFQTMFGLFEHNPSINESQITSLFEALGSRFEVQRAPNTKIIDKVAAAALHALGEDPIYACANADPSHASYDLNGAKPRLLREVLSLLESAGITREKVESAYSAGGGGQGRGGSAASSTTLGGSSSSDDDAPAQGGAGGPPPKQAGKRNKY